MTRLLRLLGLALSGSLVLALLTFLVFSIYATRKLERAQQNYTEVFGEVSLAELGPRVPSGDRNAATWLVSGSAAIVNMEEAGLPGRLSRTRLETWSGPDFELARRTIEANQPAFELLERALACDGSSFGIEYADGAYARLPDFLGLVRAHALVLTRARMDLAAGDLAAAAKGTRLLAVFTDALNRESLLISTTIAVQMDLGYLDAVREAIDRGLGDEEWLAEVEATLGRMNRRDALWRAFQAEGAVAESLSVATMDFAWGSPALGRLGRPALRILKAGFLEAPTDAAHRLDTPFSEWVNSGPELPDHPFEWQGGVGIHPHLMNSIGKQQAQETGRQLALEAVRLRLAWLTSGTYPTDELLPESDPLSGAAYVRSLEPGGSLRLAAPEAEKLYLSSVRTSRSFDDVFDWRLPAHSAVR